jgi:hypothetical protein
VYILFEIFVVVGFYEQNPTSLKNERRIQSPNLQSPIIQNGKLSYMGRDMKLQCEMLNFKNSKRKFSNPSRFEKFKYNSESPVW